jgi:hypothetical protein
MAGRKVVYVLGAGFSFATKHKVSRGRTALEMPLQQTFFSTLNRFRYRQITKLDDICQVVRRYFSPSTRRPTRNLGLNRNADLFGLSIEEIVTFFDEARLRGEKKEEFTNIENRIRDEVIGVVTFLSKSDEVRGNPVLRKFRSRLKQTDTIISFNWDTLVEQVLINWERWHPSFGYGAAVGRLLKKARGKRKTKKALKRVRLLKLHGSVNWIASDGKFKLNNNLLEVHASKVIFMPPKMLKSELWESNSNDGQTGNGFAQVNSLYKDLWEEAESSLRIAKSTVFIGYSFPSTDFAVSNMLRRAIGDSKDTRRDLKVEIVDPNAPDLAKRMEQSFKIRVPPEDQYLSLDSYLFTKRT